MFFPRDHRYLAYCNDCEWWLWCGRAPFRGQTQARKHAQRQPGHGTSLLDVDAVTAVTGFRFDAIDTPKPGSENSAPF